MVHFFNLVNVYRCLLSSRHCTIITVSLIMARVQKLFIAGEGVLSLDV